MKPFIYNDDFRELDWLAEELSRITFKERKIYENKKFVNKGRVDTK